jgi:hypothetical protein
MCVCGLLFAQSACVGLIFWLCSAALASWTPPGDICFQGPSSFCLIFYSVQPPAAVPNLVKCAILLIAIDFVLADIQDLERR